MLQNLKTQAKSRTEYMSALYKEISSANKAYLGATIRSLSNDTPSTKWLISVKKSQECLKRFKEIASQSNYLIDCQNN